MAYLMGESEVFSVWRSMYELKEGSDGIKLRGGAAVKETILSILIRLL